MPLKSLPSRPNLDHLKHQAKDLLNALKSNTPEAVDRLRQSHPLHAVEVAFAFSQTDLALSDAQLVVAREYGFESWPKLKAHVETAHESTEADETTERGASVYRTHGSRVAWFLENACPDHHVRGGPAHMMAQDTAMRLLERHPEIARHSIHTAVVMGDLEEVQRILAQRPQAASAPAAVASADREAPGKHGDLYGDLGAKGWDPLLFLCFARLPVPAIAENAVAIARLLLENGAEPNTYFMAGDSRYTPLSGVIGEGEESRPPHPRRDDLTRLLLRSGAEPYDKQVLYNIHFKGDARWFLELIYAQSFRSGKSAAWNEPEWSMLDMGDYGTGARYLLDIAIRRHDAPFAEWILSHGANPNAQPPIKPPGRGTLYEEALRNGCPDIASLLVHYGAVASATPFTGPETFNGTLEPIDKARVSALCAAHPAALLRPEPLVFAAEHDQAETVAFLLDLGMSPDLANPKDADKHPLHYAAGVGAVATAEVLIARGAAIDPRESNYGATPLWTAIWEQQLPMIDLLSRTSRDVWGLSFCGKLERLRTVLAEEPHLAKVGSEDNTPLMWLPGDDHVAIQTAELFLTLGANPYIRNQQGLTAAECASRRGLNNTAALLRLWERKLAS